MVVVARVLPNVTGLDKAFDYCVPGSLVDRAAVGSVVRVRLNGRSVRGWIVEIDPADAHHGEPLVDITKVSSHGPASGVIELAEWASVRWAGRLRHFMVAGSPARDIVRLPGSQRTGMVVEPRSPATTTMLRGGGGVLRLPPASDPLPAVLSAIATGPTLVVTAGIDQSVLLGARLRRSGVSVAVMPEGWAAAAGGVDVVVGARTAAWAPCPGLTAAVLLDEHDEAHQAEGSPTWHARDVLIERCRRSGAALLLVSPCPTVTALEWGQVTRPPKQREFDGWPLVEVVDRSDEEPWKRSLLTSPLIQYLRDETRTVVCVTNDTGRARLLACRQCRSLTRCERCDAAVYQSDDGSLVCRRCHMVRPPVCLVCGAGRFANLRPGVTRLREELEAAAGRPVVAITGASAYAPEPSGVYVGTEAALHRVETADVVAFLDIDRELLAPRYRAGEQAMGLLVRAARLVGPRTRGGRLLVQTFIPNHEVLQAVVAAEPGLLAAAERERRAMLGLPPFAALAEISGPGSDSFVESLDPGDRATIVAVDDQYLVRAVDWQTLGEVLATGVRAPGKRLRIAVDPPR
jgi:primosomal protein N' (replication factor Y)